MQRIKLLIFGISFSLSGFAAGQESPDQIREDVNLFAGVLEESLGLNERSSLFGMSMGGVESTYVRGQGLILNIRSPLANRRNTLSLASLNNAMQSLQGRANPLESIRSGGSDMATSSALALTESSAAVDDFYQQMQARIADVDFSLVMSSALQQASEAMRSLRSLGDLDEQDYAELRSELDRLRDNMEQKLSEMRALQSQAQEAATSSEQADQEAMMSRLNNLVAAMEPLRTEVVAKANELQARTEAAEQRHAEQWQDDVAEFESRLYALVCDYSASLRFMAESESLALVLERLGDDADDNTALSKIHVIAQTDIQSCQRGAINAAELMARSDSYSY